METHNEVRRCRAKSAIRSHRGFVVAGCRGIIEGEMENLGRHLIAVKWDDGPAMYVFPDEISIDNEERFGFDVEEDDR